MPFHLIQVWRCNERFTRRSPWPWSIAAIFFWIRSQALWGHSMSTNMHHAVQLLIQVINLQLEILGLLLMGNMTSSPWLAFIGVVCIFPFHPNAGSLIMLLISPPPQAEKLVCTLRANWLLSILFGVSHSLDKEDCRWSPQTVPIVRTQKEKPKPT